MEESKVLQHTKNGEDNANSIRNDSFQVSENDNLKTVKSNKKVQNENSESKNELDKSRDFQNKLRKFKINSSGKIAEYRKRTEYTPPTLKRKKKSEEARRRNAKRNRIRHRRDNF